MSSDPSPPPSGKDPGPDDPPTPPPPPPEADPAVQACLSSAHLSIVKFLCSGSTCSVYQVQHHLLPQDPLSPSPSPSPGAPRYFAAKVITHSRVSAKFLTKLLPNELAIVRQVEHPNVLQTVDILRPPGYSVLVSELATEGDLLQLVQKRDTVHVDLYRRLFGGVTGGLAYLHRVGIAHRDIKADNVLLFKGEVAKLADFGFAVFMLDSHGRPQRCTVWCGSPEYAAPEILRHSPYNPALSDVFSLGVLLYLLMSRTLPFGFGPAIRTKAGVLAQYDRIMAGRWTVTGEIERDPVLKSLLDRLLAPEPNSRLTAQLVLGHAWMIGMGGVKK